MSDDALAQAILNPTTAGDGFGAERRSKGEETEINDLEIKEPSTEDELGSDLDSQDEINDHDDDSYNPNRRTLQKNNNNVNNDGSNLGRYTSAQRRIQSSNARTGPKGVLRDRHESDQKALKAQREKIQSLNSRNRLNFSALTLNQEERLKRKQERELMRKRGEIDSDDEDRDEEDDSDLNLDNDDQDQDLEAKGAIVGMEEKELKSLREKRLKELKESRIKTQVLQQQRRRGLMSGAVSTGRWFGHLREVDEKGFVKAVEEDSEATSVVVHIYGKSVPACVRLTSSLSSLARLHPRTKFLQVKASSIGFGSSSSASTTSTSAGLGSAFKQRKDTVEDDDHDDDGGNEGHDEEKEGDDQEYDLEREDDEGSKDVLPTILVYRKGILQANLVRPDFLEEDWRDGDERGIREILIKYGALPSTSAPHDDFSYAWNDVSGTAAPEDE